MSVVTLSRFVLGRSISLTGNDNDTYLHSLVEDTGLPERDIVSLIARTCNEASSMVDVGANIGYISIVMSHLAPKGKITSFEPAPKTYAFLKKNLKNNQAKNVTSYNLGLSDHKSKTTITYAGNNSSGAFISKNSSTKNIEGHVEEEIKLETLDSQYKKLGITKCDFLKVDIEGHEPSFLAGAEKFIATFKPTTIMEANHWCLNVFNRKSLPDFIDLVYKHYPYVFAFGEGQYLDISDQQTRYNFFYQNTVNNRFTNLYCGFNKKQLLENLMVTFDDPRVAALEQQNQELTVANAQLNDQYQRLESSKPQKIARKVNRLRGR